MCDKDSDNTTIKCNIGICSMYKPICFGKQLLGYKCPKDLSVINGKEVYICESFFDSKEQLDRYLGEIIY